MARLKAPEIKVFDDAGVIVSPLRCIKAALDLLQLVEIHIQIA